MTTSSTSTTPQSVPVGSNPPSSPGPDPSLRDRYAAVKARIAAAAKRAGNRPDDIMLVAVSKYAEPDQIRELIRIGHVDFAENKVQPLIQRAAIIDEWIARQKSMPGVHWPRSAGASREDALGPEPAPGQVRWHMVGHLQRNKARKVVELCRLIHSVDSLRLAEEVQVIAARREKPVEVLLQVNTSGEASKHGCAIGAAIHLAEQIETMVQVRVRGLMTMAPHSENPSDARGTFGRCRELFHEVRDSGVVSGSFNILSMGMSGDFEVAVEEGANMVRVGSAIFGEPRQEARDDDDKDGPTE